MAADFSRIRNNPLLDFAGVELKQGGVLLDADFNELVAVVDRRLRAAASDILGRARVSSTTPDAFKIAASVGTLSIGKGRLYVDGMLAECHGGPSDEPMRKQLDPLLAEPTFPEVLSYDTQPFFTPLKLPSAVNPPALPTSGKHLVYLDVWEREVTHIEQPELVEVAVNVETSSRKQVVWQVRALAQDAGNTTCATPDASIPGWIDVMAPSVARLSTGTYEPQSNDSDPCELPPTGGYRGLENQTYRIEVHDAGLPGGTATFKWSRDNASVASRVTNIVSAVKLELASLGRDDVLRLRSGDWVEISNDYREQSQRGGDMRRVTVDDAARTIEFTPALASDLLPVVANDADYPNHVNLRVRRWDHQHQVLQLDGSGQTTLYQDLDASNLGAIKVPPAGTTLILENGITVSFAAATGPGRFRAGDHWVVAARTVDASVEKLSNEPPRGIHHHYARLGVWDVATGQVTDCRHGWPPAGGGDCKDCSCTECVTPESHRSGALTIQAAVDRVIQRGGGTVCLAIGTYLVDKPVWVQKAKSLRIQGEGAGTLLYGLSGAFTIIDSMAVSVQDLSVISTGHWRAIHLQNSIGATLQRLVILAFSASTSNSAIGLSGAVVGATIRENLLMAQSGIHAGEVKSDVPLTTGLNSTSSPSGFLLSALLRIENNVFVCAQHAVDLSGMVIHLMRHDICGNDMMGCGKAAIKLLGVGGSGSTMRLMDNNIAGSSHGIVTGISGLWIERNKLTATRKRGAQTATGSGIVLMPGLNSRGIDECQILANQIRGYAHGGIVVSAPTVELLIKLNIISHCGLGIVIEDTANTVNVSVENNHLHDIDAGDDANKRTVGISLARANSGAICGNIISRVGMSLSPAPLVAGILVVSVDRLRVAGNSLVDIGPDTDLDRHLSAGVMVRAPFQKVDIVHNQIDRETKPQAQMTGRFSALLIDELTGLSNTGSAANFESDADVSGQVTANAAGATVIFGMQRMYLNKGYDNATVGNDVANAASVSVLGNTINSRGSLAGVRIRARGDCLFSDNHCDCRVGNHDAVLLVCETSIVNANRVRGGEISIHIQGKSKRATVLGNITTGSIDLDGPLGAPWADLNVRG